MDTTRHQNENRTYAPDDLKIVCQAFDQAWSSLSERVGREPAKVDAARQQLADIILSFPMPHARDAGEIRDWALQMMERDRMQAAEPAAKARHIANDKVLRSYFSVLYRSE